MIDIRLKTLLTVMEEQNFSKAAQVLSLTQPAVSHHIRSLEEETETKLLIRKKGELKPTPAGEIVIQYAKRFQALEEKMYAEMANIQKHMTTVRIGITHTAESNQITEILAKLSSQNKGLTITIITDTTQKLYNMVENDELDLAIVDGKANDSTLHYLMLDTDDLVCVVSNHHPLAQKEKVSIAELKKEKMILRLQTSATRRLFESTLESINDSIDNFDIILEVDNIATIKDLIRKEIGISILAKSACMDELKKGKITVLPIENLSMVRNNYIIYSQNFHHTDLLDKIIQMYLASSSMMEM
ncbi:MAG: LysR family transcriptional regulator [Prevotella sp.]|nr:LysR family transcriptional regulator [Staphylococcus sp.]MCM1350358.1 LysR family transcriptional regulator [Prevotella sp.]